MPKSLDEYFKKKSENKQSSDGTVVSSGSSSTNSRDDYERKLEAMNIETPDAIEKWMQRTEKGKDIYKLPKVERLIYPDGSGEYYEPFTSDDVGDLSGMIEKHNVSSKNNAFKDAASRDADEILEKYNINPESRNYSNFKNSADEISRNNAIYGMKSLLQEAENDSKSSKKSHAEKLSKKKKAQS